MADDQEGCVMTDTQIKIANHIYTGISFLSFVVGLVSVLLNRCYNCRNKSKHEVDPIEGIFITALITFCILELVESFQWFALLKDFVGCTVLGVVKEYVLISILVIATCMGTHLLVVLTQPKCLKVIKEEKQRRYRILQRVYITVSLVIPILFVPWPFLTVGYGKDEFLCWLAKTTSCNVSHVDLPNNLHVVLALLGYSSMAVHGGGGYFCTM